MKASQLRHRIKVYSQNSDNRSYGDSGSSSFEHVFTLSAAFEPLSVKDVINAKAAGSALVARCKLRYRQDITSKMRIEHRGRFYEIDGDPLPDPNSGTEYMTLTLRSISSVR